MKCRPSLITAGRRSRPLQVAGTSAYLEVSPVPYKKDTPCSVCGELMWSGPNARPADQRVCRPCRRTSPVPYGPRGPEVVTVACVVCSAPFERARRAGGKPRSTCSVACRRSLWNKPVTCADCGTAIVAPSERCDHCREARRREAYRRNNRRRRAALRGAASEPYTLDEIAERDRFRCQLCRRPVDMEIPAPDPASPSIDHVIPLVAGGDDVRANVQLAHFGCNSAKGARGTQQLALMG